MQGSLERQALEEALRDEKVGSTKIQALADYVMLKDIEWRTEQRPAEIDELDGIQLIIEKTVLEQHIRYRKFHADAYAYIEALKNAEAIVQPYVALDTPCQVFLDGLLRSWQGVTLSTSLEEVHDYYNKTSKYYRAHWFVRD